MIAIAATTAALEEVSHRVALLLEEKERITCDLETGPKKGESPVRTAHLALRDFELTARLDVYREVTMLLNGIREAACAEERQ